MKLQIFRWAIFLSLLGSEVLIVGSYYTPNVGLAKAGLILFFACVVLTVLHWLQIPGIRSTSFDSIEQWAEALSKSFFHWPMPRGWTTSPFPSRLMVGGGMNEGHFQKAGDKSIKGFLLLQYEDCWVMGVIMCIPFYLIWENGLYGFEMPRVMRSSRIVHDVLLIGMVYFLGLLSWFSFALFTFRFIVLKGR